MRDQTMDDRAARRAEDLERGKAVTQAVLHARMRWLGVVLFLAGLLSLGGAVALIFFADGRISSIFISLFACGLGLGTFGAHNDTALAQLRDHRWHPGTPERLAHEVNQEFLFNRIELSQLRATPKTSWIVTVAALAVLAWAVSRLVTAVL